ncbi:hypothetical protein OAF65_07000 [Verrucomicrobiales bacterium]|nr:hypothetical protein [Verrucomicrobiales bacterium]
MNQDPLPPNNEQLTMNQGSNDKAVPQKESEVLVEALKEAGNKSIKFTSYKGVGHDSWTRTYSNPEFYKWLYSHGR